MKTLTFNYTKDDGSVSERTLLALNSPTERFSGIHVSSLDPVKANSFIAEVEAAHEVFIEEMRALQIKYDLKHNYRQFLANKMSEVTEI